MGTNRPSGFRYEDRKDGIVVYHHDKRATVLRGSRAEQFRRDVEYDDPQELMARLTGNYKRGNERMGKNHPRNRGR